MREEAAAEADTLYQQWFRDTEPPLHERAVIAYLRRDSVLLQQVIADAATAPGRRPGLAALAVARYFREMETAERLARAGVASSRTPELLAFHHRTLADIALARGRRADARRELLESERHSIGMHTQRALCAVAPFLPPADDLIELMRAFEAHEVVPTGNELERSLAQHIRLYVLALLKSAAGDHVAAQRLAEQLEGLPVAAASAGVARALAQTIRGDVAWRRGRFAEAITLLEPVDGGIPSDLLMAPVFAQEHARYVRADSYLRLGNHQEALRWFQHGFQGTPSEVVYMAPVHLRLGEIHDALGDHAQAARHYSIALALWDRADPEIGALLTRARERHQQLTAPRSVP